MHLTSTSICQKSFVTHYLNFFFFLLPMTQVALEELHDLKEVWSELSKVWEQIDQMKEQPWVSVQPRKVMYYFC